MAEHLATSILLKRRLRVEPMPNPPQAYDGRHNAAVHEWFELSYSQYLVLPRSLMQAMPIEWQERMVACLREMGAATASLEINDKYTVLLRGAKGKIVSDPYSNYRRPVITSLSLTRRDKDGKR